MKSPTTIKIIKEKKFLDIAKDYLGCKTRSEIDCIHESYASIFEYLISLALKRVIKERYDLVSIKSDLEDMPTTTYRFLEAGNGKADAAPLTGSFFLKIKNGERIILSPSLYNHSGKIVLRVYFKDKDMKSASNLFKYLKEEISKVRDQKFTGEGKFLVLKKDYSWDGIVLPEEIKRSVISNVVDFFNKHEYFEKRGIPFKRGLLFHGKPGLGKSLVGMVLASQVKGINFIYVTPKDLESRPTAAVSNIYRFARMLSPVIVFFEDLDLLGGVDRWSPFYKETLGELLNQLDGFESNNGVVTIATTNKPEALDEAMVNRPGRFDLRIEFTYPDFSLRLALLKKLALDSKLKLNGNLEEIAGMSEGFSYAQVQEILTRSQILSLEENCLDFDDICVTTKHLKEVVKQIGAQNKSMGFINKNKGK